MAGKECMSVKLASSTNDHGIQLNLDWPNPNKAVRWLCLAVCASKTQELLFVFIDVMHSFNPLLLPLQLDLLNPVKIFVFGMMNSCEAVSQCFTVCSSAVRNLTQAGYESEKGIFRMSLGKHNMNLSITKFQENAEKIAPSIQQQPPSWYYVSNLPASNVVEQLMIPNNYLLILQQTEGTSFEEVFILLTSGSLMKIPIQLQSARQFSAKVYMLNKVVAVSTFNLYKVMKSSLELNFRTYMTQSNLSLLLGKATAYLKRQKKKCPLLTHFFRNKPPSYFENIFKKRGGIMEKYSKDMNGDQASSINGNVQGLFFSAFLDPKTHQPPPTSWFGRRRLHISSQLLYHNNTCLYFADFYCHYQAHYVTVVLTERGSEADTFCQGRLLPLDPHNNPFLFKKPDPAFFPKEAVFTNLSVLVEVFYTESIDIKSLMNVFPGEVFFTNVATRGAGSSKPLGIPKRKGCEICNIY